MNSRELEFRRTFDDLSAGSTDWIKASNGLIVVGCKVWSSSQEKSCWLAVASTTKHHAAHLMKRFGVHGLKFNAPTKRLPVLVSDTALANPENMIAMLSIERVVIF